ncbi:hypothetical protein [Faecalibacillus intestinalis]|uniref:hypothetical protein n=1 Tax=Faecalibacillus intestinalis TaxID=1982626 RepID=UPI003522AB2B
MIYKEKANKTYIIKRGKSTKSFLLINHTQNNISLGLNLGRKEDIIKVFHWVNSKDMISKIKAFISSPSSATTMLFVYKS